MADEFFYIEEVTGDSGSKDKWDAFKTHATQNYKENNRKNKNVKENRLHEIEQHIKLAESKCNTLKGQVEHMRMLYNDMSTEDDDRKPSNGNFRQLRNQSQQQSSRKFKEKAIKNNEEDSMSVIPQRDTNNKQDATNSINNIISDITHSVNRLTNLQVHIGGSSVSVNDPIGIQTVKCSPRDHNLNDTPEKPYQTHPNQQLSALSIKSAMNKISGQMTRSKKAKIVSSKHMSSSSNKKDSSASLIKKVLKMDRKTKAVDSMQLAMKRSKRKQQLTKRTPMTSNLTEPPAETRQQGDTTSKTKSSTVVKKEVKFEKLIELYHNSAIKIPSESETDVPMLKKASEIRESSITSSVKQQIMDAELPPLPSIIQQQQQQQQFNQIRNNMKFMRQTRYNNNNNNMLPVIPEQGSYMHSYDQPTIASKLKQVAHSYLGQNAFRAIPFVAAKSTSPSHNLGVNIQQVLSIIKGRKPISGLSPTLTYNIQLAANKLGSRPLSALVSTLGSRMTTHRNQCPLLNRHFNYNNLQDMAKDIPEENEQFEDLDDLDKPTQYDGELPHGSGDIHKTTSWSLDPDKSKDKCTCLPKSGVTFNEIYSKYSNGQEKNTFPLPTVPSCKKIRKPWNPSTHYRRENYHLAVSKTSQISRRERSLKEILQNLHDEFSRLNERYDELKEQVNNETGNNDVVQELETLEKDLQNKEDEITMVMKLYKEVLTLKEQVTILKKRASQSTIFGSSFHRQKTVSRGDGNASGHLANLLRYVQQFQKSLNKKQI